MSYFHDSDSQSWELPSEFSSEDIRLSEDVLEKYIKKYTNEADLIFDPFAGYGTTLVVAERLNRIGLGYEIVKDRAEYARTLISENSSIVIGDITKIVYLDLPLIDLCISSPPYMNKWDRDNPLSGYLQPVSSYEQYVQQLATLYIEISSRLKPSGHLVIQLQNLKNEVGTTTLAWDLHHAINDGMVFLGEEVTTWNNKVYGYSHGYCLRYMKSE